MERPSMEYHCDMILKELANRVVAFSNMLDPNSPYTTFELTDNMKPKWELRYAEAVLSILMTEEFIKPINLPIPSYMYGKDRHQPIYITAKGIAFANTDTFVDRKKRWEIEKKSRKYSYKYRWLSWVFSVIAIVVSIFSLFITYSRNNRAQLYLLPSQEKKQELTKPFVLSQVDSSHKK